MMTWDLIWDNLDDDADDDDDDYDDDGDGHHDDDGGKKTTKYFCGEALDREWRPWILVICKPSNFQG